MTDVIKAMACGPARRERQHRVEPIQRLDGGLFIDAEHRGVRGRSQIQPENGRGLVLEIGVRTGDVALEAVRLSNARIHLPLSKGRVVV